MGLLIRKTGGKNMSLFFSIILSILVAMVSLFSFIIEKLKRQKKLFFKDLITNYKYNFIACILLLLGSLLRMVLIDNYPFGLNQDEASIGYDAYSILKYGIDRNGISFPIHLISWGSGQNSLYAYMIMPFILFLDLVIMQYVFQWHYQVLLLYYLYIILLEVILEKKRCYIFRNFYYSTVAYDEKSLGVGV